MKVWYSLALLAVFALALGVRGQDSATTPDVSTTADVANAAEDTPKEKEADMGTAEETEVVGEEEGEVVKEEVVKTEEANQVETETDDEVVEEEVVENDDDEEEGSEGEPEVIAPAASTEQQVTTPADGGANQVLTYLPALVGCAILALKLAH